MSTRARPGMVYCSLLCFASSPCRYTWFTLLVYVISDPSRRTPDALVASEALTAGGSDAVVAWLLRMQQVQGSNPCYSTFSLLTFGFIICMVKSCANWLWHRAKDIHIIMYVCKPVIGEYTLQCCQSVAPSSESSRNTTISSF
jgi:hypothetical protein